MNKCIICKILKEEQEFYFRNDNNKRTGRCKICIAKLGKVYRTKNKTVISQKMKAARLHNVRQLEKETERGWKKHGIILTTEEYKNLLKDQNYLCAICGNPQTYYKRKLAVDHDHKTGKIRGLLCTTCNSIILATLEKYGHLIDKAKLYLGKVI